MEDDSSRPDSSEQFERALSQHDSRNYMLKLYVSGQTLRSMQAITAIRALCERHLHGRYELCIIDITDGPQFVEGTQIIVAPTLIRESPLPLRRLVGDMSNEEKVLLGLDLRPGE